MKQKFKTKVQKPVHTVNVIQSAMCQYKTNCDTDETTTIVKSFNLMNHLHKHCEQSINKQIQIIYTYTLNVF